MPSTTPPNGLRENTPTAHAFTNAKIVVAPGKTIDKGTLVIRQGVIVAVGADVKPPADAKVWDLRGKTIYAGLIDAYPTNLPPSLAATTSSSPSEKSGRCHSARR